MVRSPRATCRVLLAVLGVSAACGREPDEPRDPPARTRVEASPFACSGDVCSQRHVRLPDDGEWRCAEREGVVWCAGGERAAGVADAPASGGYRCGERRGSPHGERVCIDPAPDYPEGGAAQFRCRFEQERGVARVCRRATSAVRPVPKGAVPNCWIDADCAGRCDRGTCAEAG